jgi:hypothetical protein
MVSKHTYLKGKQVWCPRASTPLCGSETTYSGWQEYSLGYARWVTPTPIRPSRASCNERKNSRLRVGDRATRGDNGSASKSGHTVCAGSCNPSAAGNAGTRSTGIGTTGCVDQERDHGKARLPRDLIRTKQVYMICDAARIAGGGCGGVGQK